MTVDLGTAKAVDAQTFGQPGERTFRLRVVGGGDRSASLWMEKQQFQQLNLAFAQMLAQLDYQEKPSPADMSGFPEHAEHDFRVGKIGLGYDGANKAFVLDSYELGLDEEAEATLRVRLLPEHCAFLIGQLSEIIGGGRPLCPLCGVSIDPGGSHACIRSNGHMQQPIPEEPSGGEEQDEGP
ncbi:MAG TPA: DUF3090 family protein [Dehalococcoidia bacterium]|nr:DUF3090 family protein [Dehalococcoidia bacterium]